jgi:hypothetical protein
MSIDPGRSGYALPEVVHILSPDVAEARVASLAVNRSSYHLPAGPRGVVDQKEVPCCVSCALAAAMEMLDQNWPVLSPLFHYYVTRYDNHGANSDGFLILDNGLGTLARQGICSKKHHDPSFTIEEVNQTPPSQEAYRDAETRNLKPLGPRHRYLRCTAGSHVVWIRDQLEQGHPIVIGLRLLDTYPDSFLNDAFEWKDPEPPGISLCGGHCVVVLGYDDSREALHIQDSRGTRMFDGGRWWMGYEVVDSHIVSEVYSLTP